MATLIPALGACVLRMTPSERRLAERLESKLDDSYLIWYDVPVGSRFLHPDFLIIHPQRGILILEVKEWKIDAIQRADKDVWEILEHGPSRNKPNPLVQARHFAHQAVEDLQRDQLLIQPTGPRQGKLAFPWSYGVVMANITRAQFNAASLGSIIESNRVLCKDELQESVTSQDLQSRLWDMFPYMMLGVMSPQQLDHVRWILFPEVRVPTQGQQPTVMRVMDLQQEQTARSLGDGHRVIHGVAGSGKTMILGYRAEYLAKAHTPQSKPILILCYNEPLAVKLTAIMQAKGLSAKVHVRHFHRWCYQQLVIHGQALPSPSMPIDEKMQEMVQRVITGVDCKKIPSGQYQAVLIDEGHDFPPNWLRLVSQMVDPKSNSLLILYDDTQNIYKRGKTKPFSFKSVGIQAQGRTTVLRINYRNTKQILQTANLIAADLLMDEKMDDDGITLIKPVSSGRDGQVPQIIRLPNLRAEAFQIADLLRTAHQDGHAWAEMAVICRHVDAMEECAKALKRWKMPHQVRERPGDFNPVADTIKVLTMHASKGLEFAVVALMGVGHMPSVDEDERDEARLFYVGATRATHRLLITASGDGAFSQRLLQ